MPRLIFITHPEVLVDPARPIPDWSLSPKGRARMDSFAAGPVVAGVSAIWSSAETKAREAADILAAARGLAVHLDADLGENDRSATGYLPPVAFEALADAFFAHPDARQRGWERAVDAQARVLAAATRIAATHHGPGDLAMVSHGAVGTLLSAALRKAAIDRAGDQPFQGHYWCAALPELRMLHGWRALDAWTGGVGEC